MDKLRKLTQVSLDLPFWKKVMNEEVLDKDVLISKTDRTAFDPVRFRNSITDFLEEETPDLYDIESVEELAGCLHHLGNGFAIWAEQLEDQYVQSIALIVGSKPVLLADIKTNDLATLMHKLGREHHITEYILEELNHQTGLPLDDLWSGVELQSGRWAEIEEMLSSS